MKSIRILPILLAFLAADHLPAQSPAPRYDPSRAAAATLQRDTAAIPALRDPEAKVRNALTDENPFAPESPGDEDIGQQLILKRNEKTTSFAVTLDNGAFWTDNAAQVRRGARDDWFWVGGGGISWQPRITNRLYGNVAVAEHVYRYNRYSVLDYESGEGSAGIVLLMPELWNTIWYLNYYYNGITQNGLDNFLYQTHNINAGVQKSLLLDRKNSINLGLLASISLDASPGDLQRNEYFANVGWNYRLRHSMLLTLSYRLLCYDYRNFDGRTDWNNNFGATFVYRPRGWAELAASWYYTINASNKDAFSYNAQLAGPALSVRLTF